MTPNTIAAAGEPGNALFASVTPPEMAITLLNASKTAIIAYVGMKNT